MSHTIATITNYISVSDVARVVFIQYDKREAVKIVNHFRKRGHYGNVKEHNHDGATLFLCTVSTKPVK